MKTTSVTLSVMLCTAFASSALAAARGAVVEPMADGVSADFTRGLLIAPGASAADPRAPSVAVARVGAVRQARGRARALLRTAALTLAATNAADAEEPINQVVARSRTVHTEYASDGSAVLHEAVPIEALRLAVSGVPSPPISVTPSAIVIDARSVMHRPHFNLRVRRGGGEHTGPTVFYRDAASARRDPRLGTEVETARAVAYSDGALTLSGTAPLASLRRAGALVVVVLGRGGPDK